MDEGTSLNETPVSSQDTAVDSPLATSTDPSTTIGGSGGNAMFKKRAKTSSALKGLRKPPAPAPTITISDSDSDEDYSDDELAGRSKEAFAGRKRKRGGIIQAASTRTTGSKEDVGVVYDAKRTSENLLDPKSQATAVSAEFDDTDIRRNTLSAATSDPASDNLYRGQKNYKQLVPKREQITTKYNSMGPQKAASNIRMTTYTDYAPDVCKDYKLTGYCGFGDNCKFLHDRGDYKAGWQIDRDWEVEQQKKNDLLATATAADSDSDDDMDNVPFVCLICREDYEDPVVTKCGHYYCMTCALKRFKKTPNCLVCGTGTMGIFNKARDFEKKLEAKKKRKEEKAKRNLEGLGDDDDSGNSDAQEAGVELSD